MKKAKRMTRTDAIILLILGLILGTVFTFFVRHSNEPITKEEALHTTAAFASYEEQFRRNRIQEIIVRFHDHEQLYIDGTCIDEEVRNQIRSLSDGAVVSLIVHPKSNTIMEMHAGGMIILTFQDTAERLAGESVGFTVLGVLCYALAGLALVRLLFGKWR